MFGLSRIIASPMAIDSDSTSYHQCTLFALFCTNVDIISSTTFAPYQSIAGIMLYTESELVTVKHFTIIIVLRRISVRHPNFFELLGVLELKKYIPLDYVHKSTLMKPVSDCF